MNTREIEKLIEKFYNGMTNVEEENILNEYFQGDDIAPHLLSLKPHFNFIKQEKKKCINDQNFMTRFEDAIEDEKIISFKRMKGIRWQLGTAVAACMILSYTFFFDSAQPEMTAEQKEALDSFQQTRKWLEFSAEKIASGLDKGGSINDFNKHVNSTANILGLENNKNLRN